MSAAHGSLHHPSVPNSHLLVSTVFFSTPFSLACGLDGINGHDEHDIADCLTVSKVTSSCVRGTCRQMAIFANGSLQGKERWVLSSGVPVEERLRSQKVDVRGRPVVLTMTTKQRGLGVVNGRPKFDSVVPNQRKCVERSR